MPVTLGVPTFSHSAAISAGCFSQCFPPSVERKMAGGVGVPLPANMISGFTGSMANAQM